jgi:hypothetical protein
MTAHPRRTPARDITLVAALPPAAQAIYASARGHIDPADAFLAAHDGLTSKKARSDARNARRSYGRSWPDRFCFSERDVEEQSAGLDDDDAGQADPLEIDPLAEPLSWLLAVERVEAAMAESESGGDAELDTPHMQSLTIAKRDRITPRRARQDLQKKREARAQGQGDLFGFGGL